MQLLSNLSHVMLICCVVSTVCFSERLFSQGIDMEVRPAIIPSLTSRKATEDEEAKDRELSGRAVELLRNRRWCEGVAAAEEAWTTWRRLYGGRPWPKPTASGHLFPPYDQESIYVRQPSTAALAGAEQILEIIGKSVDADLAEALLRVRVAELDSHAYSEAGRIAMELCRTTPKAEGILLLAQVRKCCLLMRQRQQQIDLHEAWWIAPRLAQRKAQYCFSESDSNDQICTTLNRMDAEVLADAYRILSVRDTSFWTLRDLLNASVHNLSMAVIAEAIKDPRDEMRLLAARMLWRRHNYEWKKPELVVQLLRSRLEDHNGDVRYEAGAALLDWGSDAGLAAVVERSAEKLGDLIDLESVGRMGAISATPWLIEVGRTCASRRLEVVRALSALRDSAAVKFLGEVLLDEKEEALTRQLAASALGATMDDSAFPFMSKALETADKDLADRIIASMTEIRPDLSFPVLVKSMKQMGILDGKSTAGRALGIAWLRIHHCSGYRDVVGQFLRDPDALKAGMQEYWDRQRAIHEAARQVQFFRFVHPDPEREAKARKRLAEIRQRVPTRSLQSGRDPTHPPESE